MKILTGHPDDERVPQENSKEDEFQFSGHHIRYAKLYHLLIIGQSQSATAVYSSAIWVYHEGCC